MSKLKYWGGTSWIPVDDQSPVTIIVAASNSKNRGRADYVCDGVSDQTEINSALTALGVVGGKVVLLEGTFNVTGAINVPSNCTLEGQGNGTVLQIPNAQNATFNVIQNSDRTNGNTGIFIANLKIEGNKANNTAGTQIGVLFQRATLSTIQNVIIQNMRNQGIQFYSADNNMIVGNTVQMNAYGIFCVTAGNNNNTIMGNTIKSNTNEGISISIGDKNIIADNIVQTNGSGGIDAGNSNYNVITGNRCEGNTLYGIKVSGDYNSVTGNVCQTNGSDGIYMSSSNFNVLSGSICQANNRHGIYLSDSSNNTIIGNSLIENSQITHNTNDNIILAGASNNNNVQSNTCRQGALTNKPKYGINISASTCTGNLVTNNDLTAGGATGTFSDAGTGTITTAGNKTA